MFDPIMYAKLLPVVELNTTVESGAEFTAEENAQLSAAFESGKPIVMKCKNVTHSNGFATSNAAFIAGRGETGGLKSFSITISTMVFIIAFTGTGWVCQVQ